MYDIRVYRMVGSNKIRTAKIKKSGNWFGLFAWLRLWFTLRKAEKARLKSQERIARDCSPANKAIRF